VGRRWGLGGGQLLVRFLQPLQKGGLFVEVKARTGRTRPHTPAGRGCDPSVGQSVDPWVFSLASSVWSIHETRLSVLVWEMWLVVWRVG
jgi:hypothetical protein